MNRYKQMFFEISGVCNAKCPFCSTGSGSTKPGGFIDPDRFERTIDRLLALELISRKTTIHLFNWGEPFLNPNWKGLLRFLNHYDISYVISSNGSTYNEFSPDLHLKMAALNFSMPGFSQESYDKIHGFNFEVIKKNISKYANDLRQTGYKGTMTILFHIYQFNLEEIAEGMDFARSLGIYFHPYYAYLANYQMIKDYLLGTIEKEKLRSLAENLFCSEIQKRTLESPH